MASFDIDPFRDKNSERYMLSKRIGKLADALASEYMYTDSEPLGGFYYRDGQYSPAQINEGEWVPFDTEKDWWGYPECYCWFKHSFEIPERFKGKTVIYRVYPYDSGAWNERNPQLIIFIDGKTVQGVDPNHRDVRLLDKAVGGEKFNIQINAYTDPFQWKGQVRMRAKLLTVDEDVVKLYYHIKTPLDAANLLGPDDLARIEIIDKLNTAVSMIEFGAPQQEFKRSVLETIDYLEENLFGKGMPPVEVTAIGHTHIDVAWLWRLRQTRDKAGRSFASVLKMMEENPEYKFMSPQAQLYDFVKKDYPDVYEGIKQRVREGRWEVEGGMWVEADTNISSGESLVRQFLVGKRFFRREFGKDCKILWLPDVFGYTASLPQIMKGCGIDYFMTTKISWNEYNMIPYDTFMWQGIDGSEILSHFIPAQDYGNEPRRRFQTTYNAYLEPNQVMGGWERYQQKDLNKNILFSYGYGDGGGGPTQDMIEQGRRMAKGIPGVPVVKFEFARKFFDRLKKDVEGHKRLPKWCGELYLEFHRGVLTTQAINKRYNRKSEVLYQNIENAAVLEKAVTNSGFERYPSTGIDKGWEIILLNQFHDIIPGSSIKEVYEDSKAQYEQITQDGEYMLSSSLSRIAKGVAAEGRVLVVFNTLGSIRNDIVETDAPFADDFTLIDSDGRTVPYQRTFDGKIVFFAENVPAKGYKSYLVTPAPYADNSTAAVFNGNKVTSRFFNIEFDGDMNIEKLFDKKTGRQVAPEGKKLNQLIAYEDRPFNHDAWNVNCYFEEKAIEINDVLNARVIENGPVRAVMMIVRRFRNSLITQYLKIYNNIDRIDVQNVVDWKESHLIVKALFPVDVNAVKATFDIQFGNIERATHNNTLWEFAQFEVAAQKWADLSDNSFGLSVLNDCKYGYDVKNGLMRLSLIRCQNHPFKGQDQHVHYFTYSIYPHSGPVQESEVVAHGYNLNYPLLAYAGDGLGDLPAEFSLLSAEKDNIIIETVKKAEDSDEIVIRMFETWNRRTNCAIHFGVNVESAVECDMMEENEKPLTLTTNVLDLEFRPFEIKTIKIKV
jgi:alpha-mannosidase